MKKVFTIMDQLIEWLIFWGSFGFVVLCFAQVVARFIFNNSITWSEEACRYLFVMVVFLGGVVCVKEKRHTGVDLIMEYLPFKYKRQYTLLINCLMMIFFLYLTYAGWQLASKSMLQSSTALGIPLGDVYKVIPVAGLMMVVNCIRTAITDWKVTYASDNEKGVQ